MVSPCVLIIEPDLSVRHPVAEYLRQCGYKVLEAVNDGEAMLLLRNDEIIVDVVLIDLGNPRIGDGFSFIRWLKKSNKPAKVLAATNTRRITEEAGELCEEGPHLKRPYHPQQLHEEIKRLLAAHQRSNDDATKDASEKDGGETGECTPCQAALPDTGGEKE